MAKEYAKAFYHSKEWRKCSTGYMSSRAYVCERCGGVAEICHHKKYITPNNIGDPTITLNWDNLECLCKECHNKEHMLKNNLTYFDDTGSIDRVKENGTITEFKRTTKEIDKLLEKLKH